ncbi:phage uncharacterized protein TIGR01671 [Parageobacillus thermantarcticus]|uniref:Phage uncharacterized protein TIGR01671 n=1 Tax=Parageobacillus thermantarcticus TaxID=186116 RepID=A0A1I0TT98_9BACL|nr:YopX family protein [Parageobacillus thermantarcticus]SFA54813.1 phage uncharacterized protein TIGR01671 [Parageobacillus thermantarcticus]
MQIKIRAWDKDSETMIYGVGITTESDGGIPYQIPVNAHDFDQFDYYPNSIIMLYTGFKDSDGKEIYADDILEVKDSNGVICRTVVEYVDGAFRVDKWYPKEPTSVEHVNYTGEWEEIEVDIEDYEFLGVVLQHHLEFKVVGNIFQDGDLLDSEISKADRD